MPDLNGYGTLIDGRGLIHARHLPIGVGGRAHDIHRLLGTQLKDQGQAMRVVRFDLGAAGSQVFKPGPTREGLGQAVQGGWVAHTPSDFAQGRALLHGDWELGLTGQHHPHA